jgi:hypothetical protein
VIIGKKEKKKKKKVFLEFYCFLRYINMVYNYPATALEGILPFQYSHRWIKPKNSDLTLNKLG